MAKAAALLLLVSTADNFQIMSNWPLAVLFDFDGVIVHSEPLHFQAFREVAAEEKIELTEAEYYSDLIGFDDRGAFQFLFAKHDRPLSPDKQSALIDRKSVVVKELIDGGRYHALPGVDAFVRKLCARFPLAICSGALKHEIIAMLEGIGLRDCFGVITAAEDVTIGKPDPMGYLLTAKLLSERTGKTIRPSDCLVIEDAPSVVQSVRTAGFKVLAVATTYAAERLRHAHYVVESLEPDVVARAVQELNL